MVVKEPFAFEEKGLRLQCKRGNIPEKNGKGKVRFFCGSDIGFSREEMK